MSLKNAIIMATTAHDGQFRRRSNLPYIVHPLEVMTVLKVAGIQNRDVLAAAVLHDVVEDTSVSAADILEQFNDSIANWVDELTMKADQMSADYIATFETASNEALLIKLADRFCVVRELVNEGRREQAFGYAEKGSTLIDTFVLRQGSMITSFGVSTINYFLNEITSYLRRMSELSNS